MTTRYPLRLLRGTMVQLVGGPLHGPYELPTELADRDLVCLPVYPPMSLSAMGSAPPQSPSVATYGRTSDGVYLHVEGRR